MKNYYILNTPQYYPATLTEKVRTYLVCKYFLSDLTGEALPEARGVQEVGIGQWYRYEKIISENQTSKAPSISVNDEQKYSFSIK